MALESVTHISDLDAANPTSSDSRTQGDDHIRNIKTALKTDLPNIDGVVTASVADLNRTDVTTEGTAEASKVLTADSGGNIDFNNGNMTNVDIDSGTVDGATLGASSNVDIQGANVNLGSDADGDLYYRSGGSLVRLPKGTADQILAMNSGATAPEWASNSGWVLHATFNTSGTSQLGETTTIPDGVTGVKFVFKNVSLDNTGPEVRIELGDATAYSVTSGGILRKVTTGASGSFVGITGGPVEVYVSQVFGDALHGVVDFFKTSDAHYFEVQGGIWSVDGTTDAIVRINGVVSLDAATRLTRARVTRNGASGNFNAGSLVDVYIRR